MDIKSKGLDELRRDLDESLDELRRDLDEFILSLCVCSPNKY